MANETALLELVNVIGEASERGEWDQKNWAHKTDCGTSFCAAGWKAAIDGEQINWNWNGHELTVASTLLSGQRIEDYARDALELTFLEALHIFHYYGDDYDEFVFRVKEVINGEIR